MLNFFVDVCVSILICTAPIDTTTIKPIEPTYDECLSSKYVSEDGFVEVKPSSDSIQELLVVKICDVTYLAHLVDGN